MIPGRRRGFWHYLQDRAKQTLETGQRAILGLVAWALYDGNLVCELPSGRRLTYRDARIDTSEAPWGQTEKLTYVHPRHGRTSTFGGKLAENITQAVCRDLLADALVRLEVAGFEVVLHVHDEVVCEVDSPGDLKRIEELMRRPPAWATGLPIDVEGFISKRYRK